MHIMISIFFYGYTKFLNKEPKIHTPGTKVCKNFGFWEEIQNLILNKSNAALTLIILTVFKKIKVLKKF